ncbi:hypothetical protein RCH09_002660 [Actimicrobium sp. GrIS 1.19]|uniref:hypothetical protein n=1 Tax=Actimicrobium sp. GrIS 1.19 TaxID=3071708 RepID=UPI002DFB11AA|nr:hypothetical protein [Actimicrobium sp. GrIS 1.19]
MKPRHLAMLAAVVIAGLFAFFADKSPSSEVAEAVTRPTATVAAKSAEPVRSVKAERTVLIRDLQARGSLIRDEQGGGRGDVLFNSRNWTPPPPPPPKVKPAPPPKPVAPPLTFTYLGKKFEDGVWEVYLARGESTYIARANETIDGIYRVEKITPPTLSLIYLPLKQVQRLTIGGTD